MERVERRRQKTDEALAHIYCRAGKLLQLGEDRFGGLLERWQRNLREETRLLLQQEEGGTERSDRCYAG